MKFTRFSLCDFVLPLNKKVITKKHRKYVQIHLTLHSFKGSNFEVTWWCVFRITLFYYDFIMFIFFYFVVCLLCVYRLFVYLDSRRYSEEWERIQNSISASYHRNYAIMGSCAVATAATCACVRSLGINRANNNNNQEGTAPSK